MSAQRGARPTVARARSGSRRVNIPQKEVGEVWRVEDLESEMQLALLPENEVLPSVQINLFARLAERNITPGRVKTECVGGQRDKIFGLESFFYCEVDFVEKIFAPGVERK